MKYFFVALALTCYIRKDVFPTSNLHIRKCLIVIELAYIFGMIYLSWNFDNKTNKLITKGVNKKCCMSIYIHINKMKGLADKHENQMSWYLKQLHGPTYSFHVTTRAQEWVVVHSKGPSLCLSEQCMISIHKFHISRVLFTWIKDILPVYLCPWNKYKKDTTWFCLGCIIFTVPQSDICSSINFKEHVHQYTPPPKKNPIL